MLQREGCCIDAFYFCPHHPDDGCDCRKPRLGLFRQAAADFQMPLRGVMIGDNASDVQAGLDAGLTTILVRTGYGEKTAANKQLAPHYLAADLSEATSWYLAHLGAKTVKR
jgi:histidinol phosphatase-like enzyme